MGGSGEGRLRIWWGHTWRGLETAELGRRGALGLPQTSRFRCFSVSTFTTAMLMILLQSDGQQGNDNFLPKD